MNVGYCIHPKYNVKYRQKGILADNVDPDSVCLGIGNLQ